jgi:hypothetical protein
MGKRLDWGKTRGWELETTTNSPLPYSFFSKIKISEFLSDLNIGYPQIRGRMGWKSAHSLDLLESLQEEWNSYISLLCENFISLDRDS